MHCRRTSGWAGSGSNIGGGPRNTLSIWAEFGPLLERLLGKRIDVRYGDWRPGDQPVYISDISMAERELNWKPSVALSAVVMTPSLLPSNPARPCRSVFALAL